MQYSFGVDVGGTFVKIGLFRDGELIDKRQIPTYVENGGAAILPDTAKEIENLLKTHGIDRAQVRGIGVGVPGPIDETVWSTAV